MRFEFLHRLKKIVRWFICRFTSYAHFCVLGVFCVFIQWSREIWSYVISSPYFLRFFGKSVTLESDQLYGIRSTEGCLYCINDVKFCSSIILIIFGADEKLEKLILASLSPLSSLISLSQITSGFLKDIEHFRSIFSDRYFTLQAYWRNVSILLRVRVCIKGKRGLGVTTRITPTRTWNI